MDVLITYVDGNDPLWQEDFSRTVRDAAVTKRYRDMGTFRYLFRALERYLPFVRKVHLLVARDSQVPAWINRDEVHVVTHDAIIPQEHLPVFNSSAIEMFLHRIPGLDEQFLYFNDDCFPVADCAPEDFFRDAQVMKGFGTHLIPSGAFRRLCFRSDRLARRAAGVRPFLSFLRPQHTCSPMLRSVSEEAFRKMEPAIMQSLTPLREDTNYNQYFFLDYYLLTGRAVKRRFPAKYFSLAFAKAETIAAAIDDPGGMKMLCINDARVPADVYDEARDRILAALERRFPEKSRYEL